MWINVNDVDAQTLLAVASEDAAVKYFQDRVRHYLEGGNAEVEEQYRVAAKKYHARDGDLEVDSDACVSLGDDPGAYVQCWKWVTDEEAGIEADEVEN